MAPKKNKIEVQNITKSFGSNHVIRGITFDVPEGESFVVLGGSGTGKSVLIKSIIGLIIPDEGSVVKIDGEDTTFYSMEERQRIIDKVGVLFQGGALFDSLPVWANVSFRQLQDKTQNAAQAQKHAVEKLGLVGLSKEVAELYPAELSGGMQKRVALARAISTDPEMIFFDEPTAGLDPIMAGVISELIAKCSKELGATTITITHDMHCAKVVADQVAMIYEGKFIWQGSGSKMMKSGNKYLDQFIKGDPEGPIKLTS